MVPGQKETEKILEQKDAFYCLLDIQQKEYPFSFNISPQPEVSSNWLPQPVWREYVIRHKL